MQDPLRLMVFDRTCRGPWILPGLTACWRAGKWLYKRLGRLDGALGASTWEEALHWLCCYETQRTICEVQFWGHGKWGEARIADQSLDHRALQKGHPLYPFLRRFRARLLLGQKALFWFRTCETFGARSGQEFAYAFCNFLGCRVAGHTHIISFYQSGLHTLRPGEIPCWSSVEGIKLGTPDQPEKAFFSHRRAPNTITCLKGTIPADY